MQTFTTPSGRTVLYDNMRAYSRAPLSKETYIFTATPARINYLVDIGALQTIEPITSR